jgi:integrator complex subunit 2
MAIHFHSNQFANIIDLVCTTLGMKILLRQNNTTRMKQIFTQEIFTEQVVAAHAVKVPVTINLNANIQGYLPIHCIHQLLKSRAFSKHKVVIKNWIYKQICNSSTPLHPVMPALIEVFVNSIITSNLKVTTEQPISEEEIQKVFHKSEVLSHSTVQARRKNRIKSEDDKMEIDESGEEMLVTSCNLTAQLLILYYLLYYEDSRLNNMCAILQNNRQVKSYSTEFLSELPIKYLLQYAQIHQNDYEPLFSPLLRLFIIHFPHLSLVDDWIEVDETSSAVTKSNEVINEHNVIEAFKEMHSCPSKTIRLLKVMLSKSSIELWSNAVIMIKYFKKILEPSVPRLIQELYKQVWMKLNTILPRQLWVMTINALMPDDAIVKHVVLRQENIMIEPLQVLRCDERVFRCPDAISIILKILQASLAASKIQLSRHIMDKPLMNKTGPIQTEQQREELKMALVASQESVAVQILLESCLENEEDRISGNDYSLREIRGIICTYIHQTFITEPSLCKLVHFQGYPRELLSLTVRGIPSMHICLDFIPELLSMPEMDKQIFAIDLSSHLSLQYSFPKSLSVAKLCMNTLTTLLGILSSDARIEMFRAILPCIVRFAEAFPPLIDDCIQFLMQLGRIAESQADLGRKTESMPAVIFNRIKLDEHAKKTKNAEKLVDEIRETFSKVCEEAVLKPKIF